MPSSAQASFPYIFSVSKFLQVLFTFCKVDALSLSISNIQKHLYMSCLTTSFFVQPGPFDLVGTIVYEIDQHPYQNTFYNGTIEVVEPGVLFSMESAFLFTLGTALLVLLGLWINGQIQNLKVTQWFLFFKNNSIYRVSIICILLIICT